MHTKDIFERDRSGEQIFNSDPDHHKIVEVILNAQKITSEMNNTHRSPEEIRKLFSRLTGVEADESLWLMTPFYTDFGRNIRVGKNVFINHACTFMDRGGITIEDNVLIGPKVNLITINHPVNPLERQSTISTPVVIKKNAWIGIGATILPGVTVGENSIVSAGAVVTKDVPPNTIVGGIPAKVLKSTDMKEAV
ncbi:Acetyltransferase (isoleucine patch superfamily) [Parelusimicrobium proximum]|uniref:sugar O-acetyltransferase n=1 Tax=Parelusimicrobium proximum TaxID=3228953 RepID=UPI003D17AF37